MSNQADHTIVRLRVPPELKEKIEKAAEENNRSQSAEMVSRLEESFLSNRNESTDEIYELVSEKFLLNLMRILKKQGLDTQSINRTIVDAANLLLDDDAEKNSKK
ncbi:MULTISPECIES: Arc family DNA-binding protein [unclassified Acinetobacter]|uniref:Arc family DNA-binding protein n=1 Tax=unclassified Acinetobacter TaxID=196816 RepID=UPI00244ADDDC|nr:MULTISPECIES: Arc family DNA-binding protein [unclassified Acinetobacter]MDH0031333.1 Arc family DNA-binding protein [Acinetobacter sp. GD04021]MDH0887182.1 Arc family DNA-binding protein [Acinetobacter sp. GD03873]MDH1083529.1 Arc family DNA-binding protein [Acinetobacter sp. GD03983]MDH2190498.1 Arc family DNA-binding protein [Acinetobacter sp. GD03645]MDH2204056.1 Arc family DNA-binding protein [Acinetobacter sp. GD03647]